MDPEKFAKQCQAIERVVSALSDMVKLTPCRKCGGKRELVRAPMSMGIRCRSCDEKLLNSSRLVTMNWPGDAKVDTAKLFSGLNEEMIMQGLDLHVVEETGIIWDDEASTKGGE